MSLLSAQEIAEDRAMAEANLPDTCRIERLRVGRGAFDETTLQYANDSADDGHRDVIYEGPCKIQIRADINANIVEPVEVEREWAYETSQLKLPLEASVGVRVDDIATMLTAPYDASLVGRMFNIHSVDRKSIASVRKCKIREAVR